MSTNLYRQSFIFGGAAPSIKNFVENIFESNQCYSESGSI